MFALRTIGVTIAVALVVVGLIATAQRTPTMDAQDAVQSMRHAAELMRVKLSAECVRAIEFAVTATGFDQGAVTADGGVLIRDVNGRDVWVCAKEVQ
jgi:hypothetical protein